MATDIDVLSRSRGTPDVPAKSTTVPPPRPKWKTRFLLPGIILLSVGGLLAYAARDALVRSVEVRVIPVVVKSADIAAPSSKNAPQPVGGGAVVVQAPGWVEPDPFYTYVGTLTDGVLSEVLVLEGQPVKKGQVVARLHPEEPRLALERMEAELLQNQDELQSAEARLKAAQTTWDNPVERQRAVAATEANLAEARHELVKIAREVAAQQAQLEELEQEHRRTLKLVEANAVTELEAIRIRKRVDAQAATVQATQAREPVQSAKVRSMEAELVAAKENLRLRIEETRELAEARAAASVAQHLIHRTRAERDMAKLKLERTEIKSPLDGVVMNRIKNPGDALMFSSSMPDATQVLRVYDPKSLQVRVDVPLAEASKVGVGMPAEVIVGVLPDRTFKGEVTRVVHEADIQKNTLQVKVKIIDPSVELKPEMLARVKFLSGGSTASPGTSSDARALQVFAPENLIKMEGPHGTAFVVDQGRSAAVARHVMKGHARQDGWIEITEGLLPGDLLIASPLEKVRDGTKVRIAGEAK